MDGYMYISACAHELHCIGPVVDILYVKFDIVHVCVHSLGSA